ncbi:type II toxin-antitoxin system PemK/MazF family toxin, partial [Xenorhabdus bovienii]
MYIPDKGDIVSLDFDPIAGKEMMKRRPAFVI